MNVLCYMQPQRGGGVARHAYEMVHGLLGEQDIRGELLTSGPDLRRNPSFQREFSGMPCQTHPFPGTWLERAWKVCGWPSLRRRCHGFDVVYAPAEVRLPDCGIPSVVTIHDVQALERHLPWSDSAAHRVFRRKWLRWLPKLLEEATMIATVSEFTKRRLVDLVGADPSRIAVVGNGISSAFFREPLAPENAPLPSIVVIGGLRLKKGAADTLRVAEELRRRNSPLTIDVYGQHDPEWADRAASHPNVRLHGYAADDDLAEALARSTALLFLSPYEGFGIPAVEAMAAGTPAVVANAASLPEVVGDAGIVLRADDSALVADTLEKLRLDVVSRSVQVAVGRQRAVRFTWRSCVQRLVEVLRKVHDPT